VPKKGKKKGGVQRRMERNKKKKGQSVDTGMTDL